MITFNGVSKQYMNGTVALDNVSFQIEKGEFVFLIGRSGAGKSSVMKLLMREEDVSGGEIYVDGVEITSLKRKDVPYLRRSLGVVFQDFRLLPKSTVFENVAFAMRIVGANRRQIRRRVPNVLAQVGLANKARCYPHQLSGGEQQRVCIARALVNKPTVLLADEPTGNLDSEISMDIMNLLESINNAGTTILMATHAERIVNQMQKRVITIDNGHLIRDEESGVYCVAE